jgi:hypothetical protein
MWLTFIMESAPLQQRHVLRRLGVFIVQLFGAEGIGGETHVRPDLVEQRADGDAHGFLALTGRPRRRVVARRIGDGRETGAADIGTGCGRDELGVAGSDIHRSDDQFHEQDSEARVEVDQHRQGDLIPPHGIPTQRGRFRHRARPAVSEPAMHGHLADT